MSESYNEELKNSSTDPFIGCVIDGKYLIECCIGSGGMGAVYRARHTMFDKSMAIKLLPYNLVTDKKTFERFRQEAEASARLKHVNVVGVSDFGQTADGVAYLVMEYIEGSSLRQILDRVKVLPPTKVIELMKQICAAVSAAHRKKIIHRDLKPDNVMVEVVEDQEIIKVLDFGIAKLRDLTESSSTDVASLVGTPQYMSPEQCDGSKTDICSDVYSLGIMTYEMLAGTVPFPGTSPATIMMHQVTKEPPSLATVIPWIPANVEACIMRALAKDPGIRQQSATDYIKELELSFQEILSPNVDSQLDTLKTTETLTNAIPKESNTRIIKNSSSLTPESVIKTNGLSSKPISDTKTSYWNLPQSQTNKIRRIMISVTCGLVAYIVLTFIIQRIIYNSVASNLSMILISQNRDIKNLRTQTKKAVNRFYINVLDSNIHIKVDPPNQKVVISLDYLSSILGVNLHYHIEESVDNYPISIAEIIQTPPNEIELVNITQTELDNYRSEKSGKKSR